VPCTCLVIAWLDSEPRGVSHEDIRLNEYVSVKTVQLCENYTNVGDQWDSFYTLKASIFSVIIAVFARRQCI